MDKIQNAYGWDDETVLNITLRRAVQMKEAIEQRTEFHAWESLKIVEWQTQSLAAVIVNTAQVSEQGRKDLMSAVRSMSLTGSPSSQEDAAKPVKGKKTYRTVAGDIIPSSELKNYTYEEIDHTEDDRRLTESARTRNAGKNIMSLGFT